MLSDGRDEGLSRFVRLVCPALAFVLLTIAALMPRIGISTDWWEMALMVVFYVSLLGVPALLAMVGLVSAARHADRRRPLVTRSLVQLVVASVAFGVTPWFFDFVQNLQDPDDRYIVHVSAAETPQAIVIIGVLSCVATYLVFGGHAKGSART